MRKFIPASVIATALLAGISFNASATKIMFGLNPQNAYSASITPVLTLQNGPITTWNTGILKVSGQGRTTVSPVGNIPIPQYAAPAMWTATVLSQYNGSVKQTVCTVSNMPTPTTAFGGDASFTAWYTYHVAAYNGVNIVDKCWVSNAAQ